MRTILHGTGYRDNPVVPLMRTIPNALRVRAHPAGQEKYVRRIGRCRRGRREERE